MKLTPKKFPFLDDYRLPHGYDLVKRKRKLADEQFQIVTLGDKVSLGENIFTSILSFGIDKVLSLFGGNRRALTAQDWLTIIPGSGYWSTKYRNWLAARIKYDVDLRYLQEFPNDQYFVHENLAEISGGTYRNLDTTPPAGVLTEYVKLFWGWIQKEQKQAGNPSAFNPGFTGGVNTSGNFAGLFSGGGDFQTILLIGAGVGILFAIMNKKKK